MNRAAAIVIFPCIAVALSRPAFAYRPFDSTDAAVAGKGNLELELGPLGFLKTDADRFLVAPSAIFNLGIARRWELVLQGRRFILLDGMAGESRFRLIDTEPGHFPLEIPMKLSSTSSSVLPPSGSAGGE